MNREETKRAIEVMQAYVDGATIEFSCGTREKWYPLGKDDPDWIWNMYDYRVVRNLGHPVLDVRMDHVGSVATVIKGNYKLIGKRVEVLVQFACGKCLVEFSDTDSRPIGIHVVHIDELQL